MNDRGRLFWSEATMLIAVATPLAFAEGAWSYLAATVLGVLGGWWGTIRRGGPLLGPVAGRVFALAAFALLIVEYGWVTSVPAVLALSHFMILVCISKLLQQRTLRDDAQVIVLCLLLLVVAAIVSGNLLFPAALAVHLTVGLHTLIRYYLSLEAARVGYRNRRIHPVPPLAENAGGGTDRRALTGVTALAAITVLAIGAVVFILFPRVGAGMFGELGARSSGPAVTGFAHPLHLHTFGPIRESDRPVMRVVIENEDGTYAQPGIARYFRGTVLDQYSSSPGGSGTERRWRRGERGNCNSRLISLQPSGGSDQIASLLAGQDPGHLQSCLLQRYYLEANQEPHLFTCYPAIEISSRDFDEVIKWVEHQTLQAGKRSGKVLRYTIRSPVNVSRRLAETLAAERAAGAEPEVLPPDPPLDREKEILALIDEVAGEVGPLDEPANRLTFLRRLERYLCSEVFSYTLNPPRVPSGAEPIGEFLLKTRSGHCEYFASALAVMCQLKGIPARVVNGYQTGDYNPIGHFYLVRAKHAHAWVEAFIPGMDWVTFDPTPGDNGGQRAAGAWLPGLRRYLDYFQFHWANLVVAYDADVREEMFEEFQTWLLRPVRDERTVVGAVAAFVRELFGWRLKLRPWERLVYWVFSLLVVALVALVGYVLVVVSSWVISTAVRFSQAQGALREHGAEVEFYDRFCRRLEALGIRRRTDQTPAEFAEELAGRSAVLQDAPELVGAYYEVAFGRRRLSRSRQARVEALLQRLRQANPALLNDMIHTS